MKTKDHLQCCVMSCLVRNPNSVREILREFNITEKDFDPIGCRQLFAQMLSDDPPSIEPFPYLLTPVHCLMFYYRDYLPTGDNARYYVEEFYENLKKSLAESKDPNR